MSVPKFKHQFTIARLPRKDLSNITLTTQIWLIWQKMLSARMMAMCNFQLKTRTKILLRLNMATVCTRIAKLLQFKKCQKMLHLVSSLVLSKLYSKMIWSIRLNQVIESKLTEFFVARVRFKMALLMEFSKLKLSRQELRAF